MMRALLASGSGLAAQQARIDAISNNMANLDTTGYKEQDVAFGELLASRMQQLPSEQSTTRLSPLGLSLGNGIRAAVLQTNASGGSLQQTSQPLDLAWQGDGFFEVGLPGSTTPGYTRDGSFRVDTSPTDGSSFLVTKEGYYVLDQNGQPINLKGVDVSTVGISPDGQMTGKVNGQTQTIATLGHAVFQQPEMLQQLSNNVYLPVAGQTPLSPAQLSALGAAGGTAAQGLPKFGEIRQGFLEGSNVDLSQEMSTLIETQRVFDANSKALQIADQMMGMANNLK